MRIKLNLEEEQEEIEIKFNKNMDKPVLRIGQEFIVNGLNPTFPSFSKMELAFDFYDKTIVYNRLPAKGTLTIIFIEKIIAMSMRNVSKINLIAQIANSENNEIKEFIECCDNLWAYSYRKLSRECEEEENDQYLIESQKEEDYFDTFIDRVYVDTVEDLEQDIICMGNDNDV